MQEKTVLDYTGKMISKQQTSIILIISIILFFVPVKAQHSQPDTIRAVNISGSIQVDGRLKEKQWEFSQPVSNFTQRELHEGHPATERTEVRILYNNSSLYIAVKCYDSQSDKLIANGMKWDFDWGSDDDFETIIDTYNDKRNAYLFIINPNGAQADALVMDNGRQFNLDWDGVWKSATCITDSGWSAEIEIPFSTLKFDNGKKQIWGINFERNISRKREQDIWQGWSRDSELEQVTRAGTLVGIRNVKSVNLAELRPYVKAGGEKQKNQDVTTLKNIGGDFNYLVTPTLKLNVTANTDFAETEADRVQINLTRFPLSYPEKRQFFLEGANFFDFGFGSSIIPFYSRRIGLASNGERIPIIGGLRLLGKYNGTTVGGMLIQTDKKGDVPTTNFGVVRLKRDVFSQSTIGIMATTRSVSDSFGVTYGMDYLYSTSTLFGKRNLTLGGSIAQTYSSTTATKTGLAHRLLLSYPNDFIEFSTVWEGANANFDPQVGFMRRTDFQMFYGRLNFSPRPSFLPWIQQLSIKPLDAVYYMDDGSHTLQSLWTEFRPLGFDTKSGESFEFNIQRTAERIEEEFEIYEGVIIKPAEYWSTRWELQFGTYEGRKLSVWLFTNWGEFYDGTRTELASDVSLKASKHFRFSAEYRNNTVDLSGGHFVINEIVGRIEHTPSTKLTNSIFVQWNDEDQYFIGNLRFHWKPDPGKDVYLVMDEIVNSKSSHWTVLKTNILAKVVWRFVL